MALGISACPHCVIEASHRIPWLVLLINVDRKHSRLHERTHTVAPPPCPASCPFLYRQSRRFNAIFQIYQNYARKASRIFSHYLYYYFFLRALTFPLLKI